MEKTAIERHFPHNAQVVFAKPSLLMQALVIFLRLKGNRLKKEHLATLQAEFRTRERPSAAPLPPSLERLCHIRREYIQGYPVFHLSPKRANTRKHILYTHGGAYVNPLQRVHWLLIESLIRRTGASFTVPTYPLAPEHDHQGAFQLLEQLYISLCRENQARNIVLMGDSAGGGLALAQSLRYRDAGFERPGRLILLAPWVDVTNNAPDTEIFEREDPMLGIEATRWCGQAWAGSLCTDNPLVSPLFGDLRALPPIDIYQGTLDMLTPASRSLAKKVTAAGGQARLFEYNGAFHVFPALPFTAEAKDVIERIANSLL